MTSDASATGQEPDDPDGIVWRRRLEKSFAWVRGWETQTVQPDVHPRSELAGDDKERPQQPLSQLAWIGLSSAIEHLGLACDDLERVLGGDGSLRPRAPFTLTRSALMGASQTVWLLAPDDRATRVRRSLHVAYDERLNHAAFLDDYRSDAEVAEHVTPEFLAELTEQYERTSAEAETIKNKEIGGGIIKTTRMIREAAEHLTAQELDPWQRLAFTYEWRMSSAGAHARMWPFFVRLTNRSPLPDGTGEWRVLTATLQECAQAVGAAALMTNEAVRLWELRRRPADAGAAFGLARSEG